MADDQQNRPHLLGFDHMYIETRHFAASLRFWQTLGFAQVAEWGDESHRAARLVGGASAIVLAAVDPTADPEFTPHFSMDNLASFAQAAQAANLDVATSLEPTHWGTRWMRLRDPDGRLIALEAMAPALCYPEGAPSQDLQGASHTTGVDLHGLSSV